MQKLTSDIQQRHLLSRKEDIIKYCAKEGVIIKDCCMTWAYLEICIYSNTINQKNDTGKYGHNRNIRI